ncbi:hypothetical protein Tco_0065359 [Tanacetum coccineum]
MGDENSIRTLGDLSKPSHEGYKNTIKLPIGNNVVPLRSDTIQLVQNGCSFHELRSEDLNQHLKDFLKLVDSLDLDGKNRERTRMCLFQFSLRGQASNWLERLPAGSITTWEDLTTLVLTTLGICHGNPNKPFVEYAPPLTDEAENDDSSEGEPEEEGSTTTERVGAEYFDIFPTRSELAYHKYLMCSPIPSIFLRNPIITEGCPSNLKIPCNIGHVHIMKRKLDPRENSNRGVSNFIGRIKGMHVFVGNFTYIIDFMIVKDISSIIDPRLSQVVLGKPFVEISNMTHDPPEGVVRFINWTYEVAYKMPHKIEQYNSLTDLEKEHTKSVYLRNEEDKIRGVEYVMSKILVFYKECLVLGAEYVTGMDDEGEVT